jgi:Tol biopolymer transport system component
MARRAPRLSTSSATDAGRPGDPPFWRAAFAVPVAMIAAFGFANPSALSAQTVEQNDSSAKAARSANTLPLIPTRTLDFTTDEGTWISLDLSPDGQTIVFELLGDLYTIPVGGGEATRITSGQGYDMQPRYSPNGEQLVFVSDRDGSENLWLSNADGSDAYQLTDGEQESYLSPAWTPDGAYVMATKGTQQWLYHAAGGSGVQVTGHRVEGAPAPAAHFGAAFGADERYVWLNLRGNLGGGLTADGFVGGTSGLGLDPAEAWGGSTVGSGVALEDGLLPLEPWEASFGPDHTPRSSARQVGTYQIGLLDRETGRVFVRTHELEGAFRPMPSPDGRWLVYATRYDDREALKLRDLETGEERWLVMDVQRDDAQGGGTRDRDVYPGGSWTSSSDAIITSYSGKIMRVAVPSGEATEIPFSARIEQEIGPIAKFDYPINDSTLRVSQIRGARPSPDGSRVAFTALDRLWIADLPDAAGTQTEGFPVLRDAERLTEGTDVEHAPVWSPDGRYVAYVTWNDSTGGDIWRVRADGGDAERLTPASAFFDKIAYTADGTRLLAVRGSKMHRMRTLEDFGSHSAAAELEYVWMLADGGVPERITWVGSGATQQGRNEPHVGPDPDRVYVWAGREGLLSMRYDGTDIRTIVKVTMPSRGGRGGPPSPDEVVLSPDGRRAMVRANRNVYLIAVPPVGGEAPTVSIASSSSMPTRRLTKVGGDFVGWSSDGATAYYSIGRSYFEYDVATADALIADSVEAARAEARDDAEADTSDDQDNEDEVPVYEATRFEVEIHVDKDRPQGVIALTGARLITMRGDEVIERGDIVIEDNRIVAIGPSGSVAIPSGADIRDMAGKTIYPGLVDVHAHAWVAWGVHRQQISQFMVQLAYGVTTQRDPQTTSEDIVTYSDLMETGELIGPRLFSTGPGIFGADQISSLDDARDILRRYSDHYNTQTIKQYLAGDRKIRQWVIMAARELRLTPTTEGGSNFTMNLTLAQDGYAGLEHSLPISPFYRDVVQLGAFSGMVYTPTFIVAYGGPSGRQYYLTHTDMDEVDRLQRFTPHDEMDKWKSTQWFRTDQYPHFLHAEQLKKWMDAGGQAGLGSHGEVQGLGTHWELWMMASGGLDNHTALQMATIMSADAIGLAGDIGSLEAGKLADLQILNTNPLDDLQNSVDIEYVMKNGRLYEGATLNEVWPRQRELPTQWWWRVEPVDAVGERVGRD